MNPRSSPNTFRIETPPPRPYYQHLAQKSIFETWGGTIIVQDCFFRLTAQDFDFTEGQSSEASYRAPVIHQIYQTPQLIRDEAAFYGRRKASKADNGYQGTILAPSSVRTTPHSIKITCKTRSAASEWLVSTTKQDTAIKILMEVAPLG